MTTRTIRVELAGRSYDIVAVCNGAQRLPRIPPIAGRFQGEVLHSADYKSP